jgi:endodeoxyribonuclease rusA
MIKLTLTGTPVSVNNIWRKTKNGVTYKTEKARTFEKLTRIEVLNQYRGKISTGALKVKIELFFATKHKRDIDNYNKQILDSLTGYIWEDDSQIEKLEVIKNIGSNENKIEVEIEEI